MVCVCVRVCMCVCVCVCVCVWSVHRKEPQEKVLGSVPIVCVVCAQKGATGKGQRSWSYGVWASVQMEKNHRKEPEELLLQLINSQPEGFAGALWSRQLGATWKVPVAQALVGWPWWSLDPGFLLAGAQLSVALSVTNICFLFICMHKFRDVHFSQYKWL